MSLTQIEFDRGKTLLVLKFYIFTGYFCFLLKLLRNWPTFSFSKTRLKDTTVYSINTRRPP